MADDREPEGDQAAAGPVVVEEEPAQEQQQEANNDAQTDAPAQAEATEEQAEQAEQAQGEITEPAAQDTEQQEAAEPQTQTEEAGESEAALAQTEQAGESEAPEAAQTEDINQTAGDEQAQEVATPGGDEQQQSEEPQQETTQDTNTEQQEGDTQEKQQEEEGEEEHRMVDKDGTPEPPPETDNMGTSTGPGDGMEQTEPTDEASVQQSEAHHSEQQESEVPHAPSPQLKYDKDATATVKFVLMPTGQVATLRCHLGQTLFELKQHFASELKIPVNVILLMFDGSQTEDQLTLGDLGVGPNGTVQLEMQSADPQNKPIKAFKPRVDYQMPDVITVRVASSDGPPTDIVVEIERATIKKPFLGGYRHKKTNIEFHHAAAQTMPKPRAPSAIPKFCRDTQTVQQKHRVQQTTNDMSTQMTKIGVYVTNMEDKLVVPGKYTTAEDFRSNILCNVVVIQKYYRRWLAKKYVMKVRTDQDKRREWERQEELRKKKEKEDRIRREFERRMNPKTKEDFDLLYHALEKWRQEEVDRINMELTGAERKAALCQLLDQETQLIASVGRHKLESDDENRQKSIQQFLDKAASAKKWRGRDGKYTEMDTPYTIRAQELKDIYNSINMKYLTQDERLDVLLTLKHTVKEHDCKLTQEIIELIDREADLLMRGVRESNLDGLRKRISTLFLQYIKTPVFNPEAARLIKVPQDPSTLRKNIYFCPSCNQYLPSTEFQLSSNSRAVGKCRKCNKMDNDARVRQDYSHYRLLLTTLRRQEETYADDSKIAFLMQENDLRHLVENVWNSQSILSMWEDLYDLELVRWDRFTEWSPWNCILLTKEEASSHQKLESLDEAYGKNLIHKVKHKHTLARNYFSRLPGMAENLRASADSPTQTGPSITGKGVSATPIAAPTKA